jgi:hypothetical protein
MFYGITAAETLLVYGANVSNAFAKAPPPKQGFYIYSDCAFRKWWVCHLLQPPLNPGNVIPVLSAMQGHLESPRLWEKHAVSILRDIELNPTVHKPCLYSSVINGNHVLLKQQVDDFAIAAPDKHTANILLNLIDKELLIPIKRQGYLDMYNGIDVQQTHDYIKISSSTFIKKISEKYLSTWMNNFTTTADWPTPLPSDPNWIKKFNAPIGDPDSTVQKKLATSMQLSYRCGVGELIWAMMTTRPNLAYMAVKLSPANCGPHNHHYHGLKHALKYLYKTRNGSIYFWCTASCMQLKEGPLPPIKSNKQDLLLDQLCPKHDANTIHAYADSDWATCVKTRRSFGGTVF